MNGPKVGLMFLIQARQMGAVQLGFSVVNLWCVKIWNNACGACTPTRLLHQPDYLQVRVLPNSVFAFKASWLDHIKSAFKRVIRSLMMF